MKKFTVVLVLMLAVVSFSGYRAMAAEDLVDDFAVTQVETDLCPMHGDGTGTGLRQRDRSEMGQRNGAKMGQMMNDGERRLQNRDKSQTPREDCPHLDVAEELE